MRTRIPIFVVLCGLFSALPAAAQTTTPSAPFQKVSELVDLPEFLPGVGILYVDPATLPAGPFLAHDRDGTLLSTIYMLPLSALNGRQNFEGLATGGAAVGRVDVQYNAGHPGVAEPHVHVILWHVPADKARELR
jgi:hypothetical protein